MLRLTAPCPWSILISFTFKGSTGSTPKLPMPAGDRKQCCSYHPYPSWGSACTIPYGDALALRGTAALTILHLVERVLDGEAQTFAQLGVILVAALEIGGCAGKL